MASLKYGCITGNVMVKEYPVAASQYFYHEGTNFVYLDGSGNATLALNATTTLIGYALVPAGRGAGTSDTYWKSSATAGADKIAVVIDPKAEYVLPATGTPTAAMRGNACDIIAVNDGNATTVDVATSSTDVLIIVDLGDKAPNGSATDVIVRINPTKFQADT